MHNRFTTNIQINWC